MWVFFFLRVLDRHGFLLDRLVTCFYCLLLRLQPSIVEGRGRVWWQICHEVMSSIVVWGVERVLDVAYTERAPPPHAVKLTDNNTLWSFNTDNTLFLENYYNGMLVFEGYVFLIHR